jgi:hypothetical protein
MIVRVGVSSTVYPSMKNWIGGGGGEISTVLKIHVRRQSWPTASALYNPLMLMLLIPQQLEHHPCITTSDSDI